MRFIDFNQFQSLRNHISKESFQYYINTEGSSRWYFWRLLQAHDEGDKNRVVMYGWTTSSFRYMWE